MWHYYASTLCLSQMVFNKWNCTNQLTKNLYHLNKLDFFMFMMSLKNNNFLSREEKICFSSWSITKNNFVLFSSISSKSLAKQMLLHLYLVRVSESIYQIEVLAACDQSQFFTQSSQSSLYVHMFRDENRIFDRKTINLSRSFSKHFLDLT